MDNDEYTGREIAIFTDAHGLLEPTKAALEDMRSRGITEIYSLGDNIGVGPNPGEVIDLLEEYGVKSVAGNSEEYCNLGIEPFASYFNETKKLTQTWTLSKLNERQKGIIKLYPHSIELLVGGKKLALCHFANDVRSDFDKHSTWTYQENTSQGLSGYEQFLYTNSPENLEYLEKAIETYGIDSPYVRGYLSSRDDPLFAGKRADFYDAVIQGHVHFKIYEHGGNTDYYSIRAVGMAYNEDQKDTASYVILKEKKNNQGFDLVEVLVIFDREKMVSSILSSDNPSKLIEKFTFVRK